MYESREWSTRALALCLLLTVSACGGGGSGSDAGGTTAPAETTRPDTSPPSSPGPLSQLSVSANSVRISWGAASDDVGVSGYEILRNGQVIGATAAGGQSYDDAGLASSSAYSYTVRARDAAGNRSAESAPLQVTTSAQTPLPDVQAPSMPGGLTATATASSVRLSWTAATDNVAVTGYEIYRGAVLIGQASSPTYDDAGLQAATPYLYSVRARDAAGNWSPRSTTVSVTTAAASETTPPPANTTSQYASSAARSLAGSNFEWSFNCGGRPCRYGRFVNGDIWVVPMDDQGKRVAAVTLTRIQPDGVQHGAEANPSSAARHGILSHEPSYEAARNVMTQLPYAAAPGTSIFKAHVSATVTGCRNDKGCVASDDVLTVLSEVPENEGATVFRPPFHGSEKPLFSTRKVRLERLSALPYLSVSLFKKESFAKQAAAIVATWSVPVHIIAHSNGSSDLYRILSPLSVLSNYGAYQAGAFHGAVRSLLGTEPLADKTAAVHALLQKGIDVYGAMRADIPLGSGAGQHLGQKPALAFFAALYDDP